MKISWRSPFLLCAAIGRTIGRFFAGRQVIAPVEVREHRLAICRFCPHFKDDQCGICLCLIDAKVMLSGEQCPDNPPRWKRLHFSKKTPTPNELTNG